MIPSGSIASFYARLVGDHTLLALAQSNLLHHLERITKERAHTFFANNGQTETGVSHNFGAVRHYCWNDTVIDCRNAPSLIKSDILSDYSESMLEHRKFMTFKKEAEERFDGIISVDPFCHVVYGVDNMRYNIRYASKIENFDTIRVGIKLCASDEGLFKTGLAALKEKNNPFRIEACKSH